MSAMRRRRTIIALVALLCFGGFSAWRLVPRHDPRLVGTWLETADRWPSVDELERVANGDRGPQSTQWALRADGSGHVKNVLESGGRPCRWRTEGERLYVQYGAERGSLSEEITELWRTLCGARPKRWHEYRYVFESAWRVRLEFGDPEHRQSHWEIRLSRIEETGE